MEKTETRLIGFREAMRVLSCSRSKLYMLVNTRKIKSVKFDRHIRFDLADIEKFIESKKVSDFRYDFNVFDVKGKKY